MTATELSKLTLRGLEQLRLDVDEAIEERKERDIADLAAELKTKATELGIDPEDVAHALGRRAEKKKELPMKYQNPKDYTQRWNGRGRRPRWFVEHLENGGTEEDMLIKKRA